MTRLFRQRITLNRTRFGITYLGWDERLQTRVAIKEYLPRELAGRDADHRTVAAHSGEDADAFAFGLGKFLEEARTLAKLDHPNLVRVRDFFEENGTGYLVMDYYDGLTLAEYLARQPGGKIPEDQAIGILLPILDGLREVHAKGFLHRDIKPANIYLTAANRPILLDFGAARQAMGEHSRSLSVVLSEGYAPIEQYQRNGKQGPWTDVYGAAATLYTMVTGQVPPAATDRVSHDTLRFDLSDHVRNAEYRNALVQGLIVEPKFRAASLESWQDILLGIGERQVNKSIPAATVTLLWLLVILLTILVVGVVDSYFSENLSTHSTPVALKSGATPANEVETQPPILTPTIAEVPKIEVSIPTAVVCDVCPELVHLPGGSFLMGSPETEPGRNLDEHSHLVVVPPFAIGKYEVTQATWRAVMGSNPSVLTGCDACPVENVSWYEVKAFIWELNTRTGRHYRLPTEAEWEYACRTSKSSRYCGGNDIDGLAWYSNNSEDKSHPVGRKRANTFGLHDMSGNVSEWTASVYSKDYDGHEIEAEKTEVGPFIDSLRLLTVRGGSWSSPLPTNRRIA